MPQGHSFHRAKITSVGRYVPPGTLTNADLEKTIDTNNEWIVTRTGIRTRHIARSDQATSDLAVEAAKEALQRRGIDASTIETIIVCTVTPDMLFPSTACLVQDSNLPLGWCFSPLQAWWLGQPPSDCCGDGGADDPDDHRHAW